jgi:serine/threonine protein kinase
MTPNELSRIREIYERAVSMRGPSRDAFLDEECHGNDELRREVERLLQAREYIPTWLDQPLIGSVRQFVAQPFQNMQGRRLSGYTLIREIGRGGMGSVYLAERSDGAFRKQAAIKLVLHSASTTPRVLARFQQEREILASLDHPNITRLLDGGATDEGWPYFVMEYVQGQPIDQWCDERRLNISRRIELFRDVIAAVRYAHQRLVIHQDLKPANILVTADGTVKLLDFGIAKVLSDKDPSGASGTITLARMMTPDYASPEQVNGAAITTLTDIYSLGVVLYLLLTGHRPYRLFSAAVHEMARVISEVEPTRPSQVVTTTDSGSGFGETMVTPDSVSAVREGDPSRLRSRLTGDLDSILLMALNKEPERRYGSVESFAADLQRHLEHRPITAREASLRDRVKRFCRRNPGAVAAGTLFIVSLFAGWASVVWQARHSLQTAPLDTTEIFLAPVWAHFCIFAALVLSAGTLFYGQDRAKLLAGAAGGVTCAVAIIGKWRLRHNLGWWHSRFRNMRDPLGVFSPSIGLTFFLAGMLFVMVLSLIGRRFGWKGQATFLVASSLYLETRERIYFSRILPALTYQSGLIPILAGAAILVAGGVSGLVVMRLVHRSLQTEPRMRA